MLLRAPETDVEAALDAVGAVGPSGGSIRPTRGLVYRHLEAMLQESLGATGYEAARRERIAAILEVLDLVWFLGAPQSMDVAGRTALGQLEGLALVFARVHEGASPALVAGELEANGIPEVLLSTAHTRFGALPRLVFDSDGVRFVITCCPRLPAAERARCLFTGRPIEVRSLESLRSGLDPDLSPDRP